MTKNNKSTYISQFNTLVTKILESNTSLGIFGVTNDTQYADGDTRPIEPANIVLGAKKQKRKNKKEPNQQMIPIQRRPKVETMMVRNK